MYRLADLVFLQAESRVEELRLVTDFREIVVFPGEETGDNCLSLIIFSGSFQVTALFCFLINVFCGSSDLLPSLDFFQGLDDFFPDRFQRFDTLFFPALQSDYVVAKGS